jgi:methylenetetrahydrofolate dehydrogenase (NADP+)/methenyltetrahydrofolate cyclohydrolase
MIQKQPWGNATVTVCHTRTANLKKETLEADILIAAAGRPEMITGDMVKPGAVVIDVGVNRVPDETKKRGYRLTGDVCFPEAEKVASFITPVPGGVRPMTITMLLFNTIQSAENRK